MNDFKTILEKVLASINQKGLDGLIVYSNGVYMMLRPNFFQYFADLRPVGPDNAMVVSKKGDVVLLVTPEWDAVRAAKKTWTKDVRGSSNFTQDLVKVMRELGIKGKVGVAGAREMTEDIYTTISQQAKLEVGDDIIETIARKKSKSDIELIRKCARIADIGMDAYYKYARPGMREYELAAEMENAMRAAGADDNFTLMSAGKHNFAMHQATDKRLEPGDILLGEITPVCEGQFVQLCRTIVLGPPPKILVDKYNILLRALDASLKTIKAGNPCSMIATAMNKVISEAGYAEYCAPPYMRTRGHGMGVGSIHPGGNIDEENHNILEVNHALVVHPNQYIPETGYLACGETVLVTETGIERLARTETKLYIKEV